MKSYLKIIPYLICILFASCASDDSHPIQTPRQVNVALTVTLPEPENVQSLARSYTDSEIRNVIRILSRKTKNNPVLIGEAGVGKSAIVEGLALRIVQKSVPHVLLHKRIFSLDVSSLVAGTKYRGQFEERINALLKELSGSDVILFIDEIHTIVGAGSTQGSLDTANILKPALARGELQCIGATTMNEYRENIEADSALERRFQKIVVEQPSAEQTLHMLRNIRSQYESHHCVRYTDEALSACVGLTRRYVTDRFFPDKAIDVMDEAGSRARAFDAQVPESLKLLEQEIEQAAGEKNRAIKMQNYELAATLRNREGALRLRLQEVEKQWRENMARSPIEVGETAIREVIASMTGIPLSRISGDEQARLLDMEKHLGGVVIGQDEAVRKVTRAIRRSRAGLKDANRPIGVFMFVGPTGVGKTHVAKELAKYLFDTEEALLRVDMSEYSEKHNVSRLIGSPPGYVGYGEGGQLTEKVRRRPYCVLLFDEIEKAHPDVFNLMLQIFDEGQLTDGLGRRVDFRNTIIIMTSNVGSREATQRAQSVGYNTASKPAMQALNREAAYRKNLERSFAPEFINRIDDIVTFGTLSDTDVLRIVELELGCLSRRVSELGYSLDASDEAKRLLVKQGYEPAYGVRSLRRTILDRVEEPLSELIVAGAVHAGDRVTVCADGGRPTRLLISPRSRRLSVFASAVLSRAAEAFFAGPSQKGGDRRFARSRVARRAGLGSRSFPPGMETVSVWFSAQSGPCGSCLPVIAVRSGAKDEGAFRSGGDPDSGMPPADFLRIFVRRSVRRLGNLRHNGIRVIFALLWNVSLGKENSGIGCRNTGRT